MTSPSRALILALLLGTALAGCDKAPPPPAPPAVLTQGASPPAMAPASVTLPPAPPAPVSRPRTGRDRYDYVNRASAYNAGFSDRAPDYAVDYQGQQPWIWQAADGAYRVVETTPSGERYYYYQSGQDQPFLVRDSEYAYGYEQGQLVVIYDTEGRPLSYDVARRQADLAGRYLARARDLYAAARQAHRQAAYQASWSARQTEMNRQGQAWTRQQQTNPDWRAWADSNRAPSPRSTPIPPPGPAPDPSPGPSGPPRFSQPAAAPQSPPPVAPQADRQDLARARRDQQAAQARLVEDARIQQAQADAAREAQRTAEAQSRADVQAAHQASQANAEAIRVRQVGLAAQAAQAKKTAIQETWQARHDAEAQAQARARQVRTQAAAVQPASPPARRDRADAIAARNEVTPPR